MCHDGSVRGGFQLRTATNFGGDSRHSERRIEAMLTSFAVPSLSLYIVAGLQPGAIRDFCAPDVGEIKVNGFMLVGCGSRTDADSHHARMRYSCHSVSSRGVSQVSM